MHDCHRNGTRALFADVGSASGRVPHACHDRHGTAGDAPLDELAPIVERLSQTFLRVCGCVGHVPVLPLDGQDLSVDS